MTKRRPEPPPSTSALGWAIVLGLFLGLLVTLHVKLGLW